MKQPEGDLESNQSDNFHMNSYMDCSRPSLKLPYTSYPLANYSPEPILSSDSIGNILSKRKSLFNKRKRIADIMFGLSAFGIVLMVIMIELLFYNPLNDESLPDLDLGTKKESEFISQIILVIRCVITISTILLVILIFVFHFIEMKLTCINNHSKDFYSVISRKKILIILIECFVCSIHPYPLNLNAELDSKIPLIKESSIPVTPVPTIIWVSVLMFLRVYQICRVIVFHSGLVESSASQSLGYLNKIELNFKFLFKTYMHSAPVLVLLFFITSLFAASGWILMACEYPSNTKKFDYINSLWLVAITFLTVGYGEMYPFTYCGRAVSVMVAIMGGFWIALTVTFMTQRLEFTRGEKYFYKFVTEMRLLKEFKIASADLLKKCWLNYRTKKYKGKNQKEIRKNERLLKKSVQEVRKLKDKARKYNDEGSIINMKITDQLNDDAVFLKCLQMGSFEKKLEKIELSVKQLDEKLAIIYELINRKL